METGICACPKSDARVTMIDMRLRHAIGLVFGGFILAGMIYGAGHLSSTHRSTSEDHGSKEHTLPTREIPRVSHGQPRDAGNRTLSVCSHECSIPFDHLPTPVFFSTGKHYAYRHFDDEDVKDDDNMPSLPCCEGGSRQGAFPGISGPGYGDLYMPYSSRHSPGKGRDNLPPSYGPTKKSKTPSPLGRAMTAYGLLKGSPGWIMGGRLFR